MIFNQIPTVFGKIIGISSMFTAIFFIVLLIPLFFHFYRIQSLGVIYISVYGLLLVFGAVIDPSNGFVSNTLINQAVIYILPVLFVMCFFTSQLYMQKYITIFCCVNLLLLSFLVIFRQDIYLDKDLMNYMTFGYWLLPSAIFSFTFYSKDNSMFMLLISIVSAMLIITFGNRFLTIVLVISFIILFVFYRKINRFNALVFFVVVVLGGVLYMNLKSVLVFLIDSLGKMGFDNVIGLSRLLTSMEDINQDITSGRMNIYYESFNLILVNPMGLGFIAGNSHLYSATGATYPHNILLEFLLHFGLIGTALVIISILILIYNKFQAEDKNDSWLFISLLCMCIPLISSGSYFLSSTFILMTFIGCSRAVK